MNSAADDFDSLLILFLCKNPQTQDNTPEIWLTTIDGLIF
jgi:hypothetical protein